MTEAVGASAVEPTVGDAGPGDVPRRPALSPSRAADFKQCPLLYRFRAIDRLPEVPGPAQVRGTLVHAVLERLYALPAAERLPGAAHALVAPVWAELCAADPGLATALFGASTPPPVPARDPAADDAPSADAPPADAPPADAPPVDTPPAGAPPTGTAPTGTAPTDLAPTDPAPTDRAGTWLAGVAPLLDAYFALEDPRLLEPQAREQLVEVELESGLLLRGYVDRIDTVGGADDGQARDDDTCGSEAREGGTGDAQAGNGATGDDLAHDDLARDHRAADHPAADHPAADHPAGDYRVVDYKTGTAPGPAVEARALFQMKFYALVLLLLRGRAPRELRLMYLTGPATLHYVPDEEQLLRFGRTLEAMWTAIRAAGATGDFRPNPGPSCAWCSHRALCPAWDGVPPPYPGWPTGPPSTDPGATDPEGPDPEATDPEATEPAAAGVPDPTGPAATVGAGPVPPPPPAPR